MHSRKGVAPQAVSQALNVHYMAHGLICTSVLRLTLKSYKKCLFFFVFFSYFKTTTPVFTFRWSFTSSLPFVCCVVIVLPCSCKNVLSSEATLHAAEPHCKRCVPTADHSWRSLRQTIFCASSETSAPHEPWGKKLSVHIGTSPDTHRVNPLLMNHVKGKNKTSFLEMDIANL